MKKFFLLIGLSVLSFVTFAEKVPAVVVNKQQGGLTAIINMYNYVTYTPAELTNTGVAVLDCRGSGYSMCRVPNCSPCPVNNGTTVEITSDPVLLNSFKNAFNDVILQYETALDNQSTLVQSGNTPKSVPTVYTKTIAYDNPAKGSGIKKRPDTYVIRGVVTSANSGNSTMKIYIEKTNIFSIVGN
jgi:hypothetical protein